MNQSYREYRQGHCEECEKLRHRLGDYKHQIHQLRQRCDALVREAESLRNEIARLKGQTCYGDTTNTWADTSKQFNQQPIQHLESLDQVADAVLKGYHVAGPRESECPWCGSQILQHQPCIRCNHGKDRP